jgi:acyl carrier protein
MELNDFTKMISDQFLEEDQPKVTADIEFRTLNTWDSLTGMAVLTIIQDKYKVSIPIDDFKEMKTITAIFNYVKIQSEK